MIEIGGKQLVMKNNNNGETALHNVCKNNKKDVSVDIVVSKMLKVGGKQLVMKNNYYGETALHSACENENVSVGIVSKMLEVGRRYKGYMA